MKEETFLLISLEESKAKKLAQAISNDTCRKILDFLAKKEATETELSQELSLPISTVHYNLKNLYESGLVKAEEFHYSDKGKEVNHYSIANKFIIIAPKSTEGLSLRIKKALPSTLLSIMGAAGVYLFARSHFLPYPVSSDNVLKAAVPSPASVASALAEGASYRATIAGSFLQSNPGALLALFFLFGALFSLLAYVLWNWLKER